jgi:hypothetical protein
MNSSHVWNRVAGFFASALAITPSIADGNSGRMPLAGSTSSRM